jgi:hypothetical protein
LVGLPQVRTPTYGQDVTIPDATTMTELIEDCAQIPFAVTHPEHPLPQPRAATAWHVDEACVRQVDGLDAFV